MPMIVTPGSLDQQAEVYHQLSSLTTAGIGVVTAIEHLYKSPPSRKWRPALGSILVRLREGSTLTEAFRATTATLTDFDLALLEAGEQSGRLDACFKMLAEYYREKASLSRQVLSELAYPLAVFHLAIFLFPFAEFFVSGKVMPYLLKTVGVLIPIYAVVFIMLYAAQGKRGETWRGVMERVFGFIPVLSTARHHLALARLAAALEAMLTAGIPILNAWPLAAAASGSPVIRHTVDSWTADLADGRRTPGEMVSASALFPSLFACQYHTGEISGKLDATLRHMHTLYMETGTHKLRSFCQWVPKILFLIVAIGIAYKIIQFYVGYFNQIEKMTQ